jgi:hypothetical protein
VDVGKLGQRNWLGSLMGDLCFGPFVREANAIRKHPELCFDKSLGIWFLVIARTILVAFRSRAGTVAPEEECDREDRDKS